MADRIIEVTHQSWFGRLRDSFFGVIIGVVLVVISFPVLFFNEKRAVNTAQFLDEVLALVVTIDSASIMPVNEGKLVHISGQLQAADSLVDPTFGISAQVAKIKRQVHMYQWEQIQRSEKKEHVGGSKETTTVYEYKKVWADHLIDTTHFKETAGHANPTNMQYENREFITDKAKLGVFNIAPSLLGQMSYDEKLVVNQADIERIANAQLKGEIKLADGSFYLGKSVQEPTIGDIKVDFSLAKLGPVTIIARQVGSGFESYETQKGSMEFLKRGTLTARAMIEEKKHENMVFTWFLRLAGFCCMWFGLFLMATPLTTFLAVIPLLSSLATGGLALATFVIALIAAPAVIALGWIVYRPLIGCAIFGAGVLVALLVAYFGRRSRSQVRL